MTASAIITKPYYTVYDFDFDTIFDTALNNITLIVFNDGANDVEASGHTTVLQPYISIY